MDIDIVGLTETWTREVYMNPLWRWPGTVIVAIVLWLVLVTTKAIVVRRARKLENTRFSRSAGYVAAAVARTSKFLVMVLSLVVAAQILLVLPPRIVDTLRIVGITTLAIQFGLWANAAITHWASMRFNEVASSNPAEATAFGIIVFFARLVLWTLVMLLILDNVVEDITALIAGLGVGGIAVALAAQNVLSDVFCSVAIVLDKPFEVGDFIIVGDYMGSVERIGIKTTRVRSLGGEQLVFSNADLISSRIRNYKRMQERRIVFSFGVIYQTTAAQLREIPEIVKATIEGLENTRFDRCHFARFGDSSLDFETVYYMTVPDYNTYMDRQQAINLALYGEFEKRGIDFAYPTRTLFIERDGEEEEAPGAAGPEPAVAPV